MYVEVPFYIQVSFYISFRFDYVNIFGRSFKCPNLKPPITYKALYK